MTRTEVVRHMAADPASVALLLSGPTARGLWPAPDDVEPLHVGAPLRSGVGFVVNVSVTDPDTGTGRGRLVISPGARVDHAAQSTVRLVVTTPDRGALLVRRRATRFLDALTELAQARSSAA